MILQQAKSHLAIQLLSIYDEREATQIASMTIEHITGFTATQQVIYKNEPLNPTQIHQLQTATNQLLQHQPIQQIIGYAWFGGEKFLVNEHVLIPRPETDELVSWILEENKDKSTLSILDIGTGSGCIAISLAKKLKDCKVVAIDVSEKALEVAMQNAEEKILGCHAEEQLVPRRRQSISQNLERPFVPQGDKTIEMTPKIQFTQLDFLQPSNWQNLHKFDIIVSNPPYIKESEATQMQANVLQYEPHQALFVPNNNALIFYEAIAQFAKTNLNPNGSIYVEINEALGKETEAVFTKDGFNTTLKKDLQGKERMVLIKN